MKKFLLSILACTYLLVASGISFNVHYCMGKISSVELFGSGNETCGKCGMKSSKSHGCCEDQFKMVKLQDSHNLAEKIISPEFSYVLSPLSFLTQQENFSPKALLVSSIIADSPPERNLPSRSILFCIFRC